jgi:hypothetical protein
LWTCSSSSSDADATATVVVWQEKVGGHPKRRIHQTPKACKQGQAEDRTKKNASSEWARTSVVEGKHLENEWEEWEMAQRLLSDERP